MMKPETTAILWVRILGLALIVVSTWQLLGGLVASVGELDPTYFGYFFQKVLAGPLIGLFLGVLLVGAGRAIGRRLARDLES